MDDKEKIEILRGGLENCELFANLILTIGSSDCEIYRHELRGDAELALRRIYAALDYREDE